MQNLIHKLTDKLNNIIEVKETKGTCPDALYSEFLKLNKGLATYLSEKLNLSKSEDFDPTDILQEIKEYSTTLIKYNTLRNNSTPSKQP